MKNSQLQAFCFFLIFSSFLISITFSSNLKEANDQAIIDQRPPVQLQTVVRRDPSITFTESTSPIPTAPSTTLSFSNTNSNNEGSKFGKSAAIVNPSIILHGKSTLYAIKESPAHVGYRTERNTITSLNKHNQKIEQHVIDSKIPLIGVVQEVKPLTLHHKRKYDLVTNSLGPITTSVSEKLS